MNLEEVAPDDWRQFLGEVDAENPFHEMGWLRAVERHSGLRAIHIIAYQGAQPVVGLPAFVGRRRLLRLFLSPPPGYGIPYLGPVFRGTKHLSESKRHNILRDFVGELRAKWLRGYRVVFKTDLGPWVKDLRPFVDSGFDVFPRYTYCLDLRSGVDAIWERMQKNLRVALRSASERYRFREASYEEARWVIDLTHSRYLQKGRPTRTPQAYLELLSHELPRDRLRAFVTTADGVLATGCVCVCHGRTVYSWLGYPKTSRDFRYANEVLLNEVVRWGVEHGYDRLDMVGANSPEIARFKAKFNPELESYATVIHMPGLIGRLSRLGRSTGK